MASLVPDNFGKAAERGFVAESRGGLAWWSTCVASALVDLVRVPGVIEVLVAYIERLRDGADPAFVIGDERPRAAISEATCWLSAGIPPNEVGPWLDCGTWDPAVAARLMAEGLRPHRLLDDHGRPKHWVNVGGDQRVPLGVALCEHGLSVAQAVAMVTGAAATGRGRAAFVTHPCHERGTNGGDRHKR